jgi:hypothetical protein
VGLALTDRSGNPVGVGDLRPTDLRIEFWELTDIEWSRAVRMTWKIAAFGIVVIGVISASAGGTGAAPAPVNHGGVPVPVAAGFHDGG